MVAVFFLIGDGLNHARGQHGAGGNALPAQKGGTANILNPYATPSVPGRYWSYPVRDPTAAERAALAGRIYATILEESSRQAAPRPRPGEAQQDTEALFPDELAERLGQWSLRWQEAQDNAAKSRAARYQALSDHLRRMGDLEEGRAWRAAHEAKGRPAEPGSEPPSLFAEVARFFRPVDERGIDRIVPALLQSERPINSVGVMVTPAEQAEIAGRVYRAIRDDAIERFRTSQTQGDAHREELPVFDVPLAERLAYWSDRWREAEDAVAMDRSSRSAGARDRAARAVSVGTRLAGPDGRSATLRAHIARLAELESGKFVNESPGRAAAPPVDMTRFPEFAEVARFFRIEAEDQLPGSARMKDADATSSRQAEAAARIYRAIRDEAVRRCRETPRPNEPRTDPRLVFDARLAERLAGWSIAWARAQVGPGGSRAARFAAIRSHIERMSALEDGRSLHKAFEPNHPQSGGTADRSPPRDFAEVARFFRMEALWELELIKSR
jgi:hypothetical protein